MNKATDLLEIPNVGPATAEDLRRLGINSQAQLRGHDPQELYDRLRVLDGGAEHDICVLDVLTAAIAYVTDGTTEPWWYYSRRRKTLAGR